MRRWIAAIDPERQVVTIDPRGGVLRRSLPELAQGMWSEWGQSPAAKVQWSWPTWAPGSRQLAAFQASAPREAGEDQRTVNVQVLDLTGQSDTVVFESEGRLPIYLQWSPSGRHLAVLTQFNDRLHLDTVRLDGDLTSHAVAVGSPLFFTWTHDDRLAVFVGAPGNESASPGWGNGRISLIDPEGRAPELPLPGRPGNFCAPVEASQRVVYVAHDGDAIGVLRTRAAHASPHRIETVDGLVALVPAGDQRHILRGLAPDGDGSPYRAIARLNIESGESLWEIETSCLAFFPVGVDGDLLLARVNTTRNLIEWEYVETGGSRRVVGVTCPTRDFRFFLRFFEQFAQSHTIIDPVRNTLLIAGSTTDWTEATRDPKIMEINLQTNTTEIVGRGVFAAYARDPVRAAPGGADKEH